MTRKIASIEKMTRVTRKELRKLIEKQGKNCWNQENVEKVPFFGKIGKTQLNFLKK